MHKNNFSLTLCLKNVKHFFFSFIFIIIIIIIIIIIYISFKEHAEYSLGFEEPSHKMHENCHWIYQPPYLIYVKERERERERAVKGIIFVKNTHFTILERFNKLIYVINRIINYGTWQTNDFIASLNKCWQH